MKGRKKEKNCVTSSVDRIWLMVIAMSLDSLDGSTSRIRKNSRIESILLLFYCDLTDSTEKKTLFSFLSENSFQLPSAKLKSDISFDTKVWYDLFYW